MYGDTEVIQGFHFLDMAFLIDGHFLEGEAPWTSQLVLNSSTYPQFHFGTAFW